jgi:uncharacterized protein
MEIIGYIASVLIGISLGLIGGGGSILTVPVLVYLFGMDPVLATACSLFVVGSTSLAGAVTKYGQGLINFKTAFMFALPAVITVLLTRRLLVPGIPAILFTFDKFVATKSLLLMIIFAILMVFASVSMIRDTPKDLAPRTVHTFNFKKLFIQGAFVGFITGLVGAGGGFLIIPALVIFSKLPMKEAVATSLFIIAINNLIGFFSSVTLYKIDWHLLFIVTGLAVGGIFAGNWLSFRIPGEKLKKAFGWFVLGMGIYIIIREIFFAGT